MVFGPIVPSLTGLHIHPVLASFEHPEGEYRRRRIRTGVFGGLLLLTPINASSQQAIFSTLHEFPDNLGPIQVPLLARGEIKLCKIDTQPDVIIIKPVGLLVALHIRRKTRWQPAVVIVMIKTG